MLLRLSPCNNNSSSSSSNNHNDHKAHHAQGNSQDLRAKNAEDESCDVTDSNRCAEPVLKPESHHDRRGSSIQSQTDEDDGSDNEENDDFDGQDNVQENMVISVPASAKLTPPHSELPWTESMVSPAQSLMFMEGSVDTGLFDLSKGIRTPSLDDMIMPVGMLLTPLVCIDLDQLYFERAHGFAPMIQRSRYRIWSKQPEKSKQRRCLQYAMWTLAASLSSQFEAFRDSLYTEGRQLLDALELEKSEPGFASLEHSQAWILLSIYEFMRNDYSRGLVSIGRAFRSIQLMRLHELDISRATSDVTKDWVELESARRTFWTAFTIDCFTAIHGGLPLTFNEQEIRTRLPAPEIQFTTGRCSITMPFIFEIISRGTLDNLSNSLGSGFPTSPFAECILVAALCGRSVSHKKRSMVERGYGEVTQDFCRRHKWLATVLASRIESLAPDTPRDFSTLTDSTLILASLVAHMNVLFLCEVIESMPLGTEESHVLRSEYKQKSFMAVQEMGKLAFAVSQLDHFQASQLILQRGINIG
ncbi:putative Zn(2)-C6 fungal-type domain-containing protein [Seiridium cardinale]